MPKSIFGLKPYIGSKIKNSKSSAASPADQKEIKRHAKENHENNATSEKLASTQDLLVHSANDSESL